MFNILHYINYFKNKLIILYINKLTKILFLINIIITIISEFITNYVWFFATQYYFLIILIILDLITAIIRAFYHPNNYKYKFKSYKLLRTAIKIIAYTFLLFIFFNLYKFLVVLTNNIFALFNLSTYQKIIELILLMLPSFFYAIICSTEITSIIENLYIIKIIPRDMYIDIKNYLRYQNLKKVFSSIINKLLRIYRQKKRK